MKKKGFTLIELLAVIVILAIIALITVPVTLNIIEDAKKGAFTDSAYALFDAYKYKQAENMFNDLGELNVTDLDLQNNKFTGGTIKLENGEIVLVNVTDGVYTANGSVKNLEISDGSTPTNPPEPTTYSVYANGTAVYYNPETNTKCSASKAISIPGAKTGCMKWYIFNDEGENASTVNMILDHNTTERVYWNSSGSNSSMNQVATALTNDTASWNSSLNAKLIEANEIARITGNTTFNQATTDENGWFYLDSNNQTRTATSQGTSKYAWLLDYTAGCTDGGCNIDGLFSTGGVGFWTSSTLAGSSQNVWIVGSTGYLRDTFADISSYGVRPVITVSKNIIESSVINEEDEPNSFATDSWETIATNVRNNNTSWYHVGDTKTIYMGGYGVHTLRIANMSACTNGEISQTACGFVVEFADIITNGSMYSSASSSGGWKNSSIRSSVNGAIYKSLPIDLQSIIINTTVISGHGDYDSFDFTTTDKLYLLSQHEVWADDLGYDTAFNKTRQLDYYANLNATSNNLAPLKKSSDGSISYENPWFLRTPVSISNKTYYLSNRNTVLANGVYGISPAFRIG